MPIDFAPFATFAVYAIIAVVKGDQTLLSTRAFTSLTLIALMTSPLLTFIQSLPSIFQSVGCFDRIGEYCAKTPSVAILEEDPSTSTSTSDLVELHAYPTTSPTLIAFDNASFSWSSDTNTVLHDLNFSIPRKSVTMIIGPVGCGKSALLESMLREAELSSGSMSAFPTSVAYCPQTPWIVNNTIRYNITGPLEFDQKWYDFTIWACALEDDLLKIPGGDMSKTGSNGVTLSGGQKQRIVSVPIL